MMQKQHQNNNLRMERKHARRKCTDINSDLLYKLYWTRPRKILQRVAGGQSSYARSSIRRLKVYSLHPEGIQSKIQRRSTLLREYNVCQVLHARIQGLLLLIYSVRQSMTQVSVLIVRVLLESELELAALDRFLLFFVSNICHQYKIVLLRGLEGEKPTTTFLSNIFFLTFYLKPVK